MNSRTAIDLFCGAGGLTQGLKQAGFGIIGAVEKEPVFAETYSLNHPEVALHVGDIQQLDPHCYMQKLGLQPQELDLLAGCPPCQGFSTIGTRNRGNKNDERNDLVFQLLRFASVFLPKTIMMENVPALANDSRLKRLVKELGELGYICTVTVLNTLDFGVPQSRRRMLLLASKKTEVLVEAPSEQSVKRQTVRTTIGDMPKPGESGDILHDYPEHHSNSVMRRIELIPHDGGSRDALPEQYQLECHRHTTGFRNVYGRMWWDKPAPTITGGCTNPSKGRFLHPDQDRAITMREAALLQTFPKDYQFSMKHGKQGVSTMIGNALPPRFIELQAKVLLHALDLT